MKIQQRSATVEGVHLGMSKPRLATSVATRMLRWPALNLFKDATRLLCDILPWMGMAPNPRVRSMIAIRCALLQVQQNMMALLPANSLQTYAR